MVRPPHAVPLPATLARFRRTGRRHLRPRGRVSRALPPVEVAVTGALTHDQVARGRLASGGRARRRPRNRRESPRISNGSLLAKGRRMVESSGRVTAGRAKDLPEFERPPVVEVALGVQFEPVPKLDGSWIARFWLEHARARFPEWIEAPALPPAIEWFGIPGQPRGVMFRLGQSALANRAVFQDASHTGLLQLQQDRFVRNWRKVGKGEAYPRYESIRASFASEVSQLRQFLTQHQLGELIPNQCEVTYVNHIAVDDVNKLGQIETLFAPWSGKFSDGWLSTPETVEVASHHRIVIEGVPVGRLHIALQPGYGGTEAMFVLTLTARGRPSGPMDTDVLAFLDVGREQIVRGFTSMTSTEMHAKWGRRT